MTGSIRGDLGPAGARGGRPPAPPNPTPGIARFSREEFITRRFHYRAGQHVTFLGSTDSGKTTLAYQLIGQVATPKLPAVSLVMKPRDATVRKWSEDLDHRIVRTWPPLPSIWQPRKPPGYVLWPKHTFDPDRDDPMLAAAFRKAILDSYKRGSRIVFADETMGLTQELGLTKLCVAMWTRGRSMGAGFWAATQKPSHIPLYAYNQAQHLFLAFEPDKRNRDRFSEIGGVDPDLVKNTVLGLQDHEWLYISRKPRVMCVVEA